MKKVTRFFSLLLAIAMVLAMNLGTLTVSAEDTPTTYKVTINGKATGHTYNAYQIFDGDLYTDTDSNKTTLSNVEWGTGVKDGTTLLTALKSSTIEVSTGVTLGSYFTNCSSAQDVANVLSTNSTNSALAEKFADFISTYDEQDGYTYLSSNYTASVEGTQSGEIYPYTISNLDAGYYLVIDTVSGTNVSYSDYILQVVKDVTVTAKADIPTVEKKVDDTNDSDSSVDDSGANPNWQDSADYDIGDKIPYQLTATLGSTDGYLDAYSSYSIKFVDELSSGLTAVVDDADATKLVIDAVYVEDASGNRVNTSYDIASSCYTATVATNTPSTGMSTITVTFDDIKTLVDTQGNSITVDEGYSIVVEYSATLNDSAVIGSGGNPNTVYLVYSNNPNGSGTGQTATDKVLYLLSNF